MQPRGLFALVRLHQGKSIKCSLHGSYFDLATGKPLNEPADSPLATYAVKEEAGEIWVQAG